MKKILIAAALLGATLTASAQSQDGDSVVIIKKPNEVRISEGRGYINVEVRGKEGNDDYIYSVRKGYSKGTNTSITSEKNKNWDFNIPFLEKKNRQTGPSSRPQYQTARFSFNIIDDMQIGMGLVGTTSQAPGMDVDMTNGGFEFFLNNIFHWRFAPTRNTHLTMGFGVDWRNYRMRGDTRFIKDGTGITLGSYPEGADVDFSRLKVFSLTLDLMLRQRLFGNVSIAAGPVVNFNTSGSLKTRYTLVNGENREGVKEQSSNIHQKSVTVDFKGELKINPIAFYIKYSPMNMLDTNYGPRFRSLSAGAMIVF